MLGLKASFPKTRFFWHISKILGWILLKEKYLTTPNTQNQWLEIRNKLYDRWQFPNCVGALDGKHIVMVKPYHAGSYYHNYKGSESIVLMGLCDAEYR